MDGLTIPDLDEDAERFLQYVRSRGEEGATVPDVIGAYEDYTNDDRGRLHYRASEKLEPAGLVERDEGVIETEGGANDADVFYVTEWGEMYLDGKDEPPRDVEDAAEVRVALSEAVGRVEDLETRIDAYETQLGKEMGEFEERLDRVEDEVDGAAEAVQGVVQTADEARENAGEARDEVAELQERIEELKVAVEALQSHWKDERERRRELEEALGDVEQGERTVAQRLDWLERAVGWLRDSVERHGEFFDDIASTKMVPWSRE